MRVLVTQGRNEYQQRQFQMDVPDGTPPGEVTRWIERSGLLGEDSSIGDFETVHGEEFIADWTVIRAT